MDNTECPTEDHVHCDICHAAILLIGEPIFATDGDGRGAVTIYCKDDAKKFADAHGIMFED